MSEKIRDAAREHAAGRSPAVEARAAHRAGFFVAIAASASAQTAAIVAFAWLVTRAIIGVIDGMPVAELGRDPRRARARRRGPSGPVRAREASPPGRGPGGGAAARDLVERSQSWGRVARRPATPPSSP